MTSEHEPDKERSLDAAIATLPRTMRPERDLWPEIAGKLQPERQRRFWIPAFASAAVIACAAVIGWQMLPRPEAPATITATPGRALPAEFVAAEAAYLSTRASHYGDIEARLDRLPPESREAVERSLVAITEALDELRAALAEEPVDPLLQHLLLQLYTRELAVLGQIDQATRTTDERRLEL